MKYNSPSMRTMIKIHRIYQIEKTKQVKLTNPAPNTISQQDIIQRNKQQNTYM